MRATMRLGKVAGIPIGVHWSVLVIMLLLAQGLAMSVLPTSAAGYAVLLYWTVALAVAAVFMASLLAHELAHALVARHYGVRVRRITLWLLGGVAELDGQAPNPRGDFLIAASGPGTSLALGVVFAGASIGARVIGAGALTAAALAWLAVVNGVLAVFNLLPGAPLDGGRVLAAALWWLRGDRVAAQRAASRAGVILGWLLVAFGLAQVLAANLGGLWLALLGWFLVAAASAENSDAALRTSLGRLRVGDVMTPSPACGYATQSVANFITTVAWPSRHRSFPVLDLDGRFAGVVSLARLARVPAERRDTVRLADVLTPRDHVLVLDPTSRLVDAAPALSASGLRLAVVAVDERVSGVLSVSDLTRAVELAAFEPHPGDSGSPGTPAAGSLTQARDDAPFRG
jgi:Zn-dependent protease